MAKPVVLATAAAVVGALLVFAVMKWKQGSIDQSPPVVTGIQATSTPAVKPPSDLEALVGPIALYPDLLLAQLLPASTYPLEVVQAARWLETNPNATLSTGQDWAPSINALLEFSQVIFMMNDRLDWTTQLGDRFLAEPESVLGTIQSLRAKAMTAGLLKDTPEQKISKAAITEVSAGDQAVIGTWVEASFGQSSVPKEQVEVIRIEPTNPQVIYVPQYNPQVLYSAPPAQINNATTTTASQTSSWLTYGAGVATGALLGWAISEWSEDDWDDHYHGYYHYPPISHYPGYRYGYSSRSDNDVDIERKVNINADEININRQNSINHRPASIPWIHDPKHRRGYRYTPQAQKRLAAMQPKPQPALAEQRKTTGQAANMDYAGFDRNQMDRARQTQVEKMLGQGDATTKKQQDKTVQQRGAQSLNPTKPKTGISQQPVRLRAQKDGFSGAQKNKPALVKSPRRADVHQKDPSRSQSFFQTMPQRNREDREAGSRGALGGIREGGRARTYSQRGQSSRTPATGRGS